MLFPIDNRFLNDATREREKIKTENSVRKREKKLAEVVIAGRYDGS